MSDSDIKLSLDLEQEKFRDKIKDASKQLDRFNKRASKYEKHADRARRSTQRWTGELRDYAVVLGLARNALLNLNDLILGLPRAILQQNAMLERNQALVAGLSDSTMKMADAQAYAAKKVQELISISSRSPFAIESINDSFTKLTAGGIKNATNSLTALINALSQVGATSEQLKRGSIAIQQVAGKGALSMEEIRQQLGEAYAQIMPLMSRALNLPVSRMVKLISTGGVAANKALESMFAEMHFTSQGFAARMSQTYDGLFNQLRNEFTILAKESGEVGFFQDAKETLNDLLEGMRGAEFKQFARDVGRAFSTAIKALKWIGEWLNEYGAMIARLGGGLIAIAAFKSVLSGLGNTKQKFMQILADSKSAQLSHIADLNAEYEKSSKRNLQQYMSIQAKKERIESRSAKKTSARQNRRKKRLKQDLLDLEISHGKEMQMLDKKNRALSSTTGKMKSLGSAAFHAVGGWTTAVTAGILGIIALYDIFIGKQKRATQALIDNKGLIATQEQIESLKLNIKEAKAELENVGYKLKTGRFSGGLYNPSGNISAYMKTKQELESDIQNLAKNIIDYEDVLKTANLSFMKDSVEIGKRKMDLQMSEFLRQTSRKYKAASEAIAEEYKDSYLPENILERETKMLSLRKETSEIIKQHYAPHIEKLSKTISELEDNKQLLGNLFPSEDVKKLGEARGELQKIQKTLSINEQFQDKFGFESLLDVQGIKKATKEVAKILMLTKKLAGIDAKNNRLMGLGDGKGAEEAKLMAEISHGMYKDAKEGEITSMKHFAKKIDLANDLTTEIEKQNQLYQQTQVRLGNNLTQMAKKIGTAKTRTDNPFLQWEKASQQTLEVIKQIQQQFEDIETSGKKSVSNLDKKRLQELKTLRQKQIFYDQEYTLTQRIKTLKLSMMTDEEKRTFEHKQQLIFISQAREKLSEIKNVTEQLTISKLLAELEALQRLSNNKNSPLDNWFLTIEDIGNSIEENITNAFDEMADSAAEAFTNTEASFSEMTKAILRDLEKQILKTLIRNSLIQAVNSMVGMFGGMFSGGGNANADLISSPDVRLSSVPTPDFSQAAISIRPSSVAQTSQMIPSYSQQPMEAPKINLINQTGLNQTATSSQPRFDGRQYIIDVVMEAASVPGKFRSGLQSLTKG